MRRVWLFLLMLLSTTPVWAFDFRMELNSSSLTITPDMRGIIALHLALLEGPPANVSLSALDLPSGVSVSFQRPTLQFFAEGGHPDHEGITAVYVTAGAAALPGTNTFRLRGTTGSVMREVNVQLTVNALTGTIIHVSTTGNDSGSCGAAGSPCLTIQRALNLSAPGSTIVVEPGIYQEQLVPPTSGTSANRIIVHGKPGAIIDGNRPAGGGWTNTGTNNIYAKSDSAIGFQPNSIAYNDKFCLFMQPITVNNVNSRNRLTRTGTRNGEAMGQVDVWDLGGCYGYSEGGVTRVRLANGGNPGANNVSLSNAPAIRLNGISNMTIRGFTIRWGNDRVYVSAGAANIIVEHNILHGGGVGVHTEGANNTIVRYNEATLNHYYADVGHVASQSDVQFDLLYDLRLFAAWGYPAQSLVGIKDNTHGLSITANYLYRGLAGIVIAQGMNSNSEVFDAGQNYITHMGDYGIISGGDNPLNGTLHVHDNLILADGFEGWRWGPHASGSTWYIYNNRFGFLSYQTGNTFYQSWQTDLEIYGTDATVYIYHNTFAGALPFSVSFYFQASGGLPNVYVLNNVLSGKGAINTEDSNWNNPRWSFDYNWLGSAGDNFSGNLVNRPGTHNKSHAGSQIWDSYNPSYYLPTSGTGADARGAGQDISQGWTLNGSHAALPGFAPGYFTGSAPDLGWVPRAGETTIPPPVCPSPDPPPAVGRVARYTFNEGSGAVAFDSSGNPSTHALSLSDSAGWLAPGFDGTGFAFNGNGVRSGHTNGDDPDLRPTQQAGISVWWYGAPLTAERSILAALPNDALQILIYNDGKAYCIGTDGTNWPEAASAGVIPQGVWTHLSCSFNVASGLTLRVNNGTPVTTAMTTPLCYGAPGLHTLQVGRSALVSGFEFVGRIDAVTIQDREITPAQNAAYFNEATATNTTTATHSLFLRPDNPEGTVVVGASLDSANILMNRNARVRQRWSIRRVGTTVSGHLALECNLNGGTFVGLTGSCATNPACIACDSAQNSGDLTTHLALFPLEGATFAPGRFEVDATIGTGTTTLADLQVTEWEYAIGLNQTLAQNDLVRCRVAGLDAYPATLPTITVQVPVPPSGAQVMPGTDKGGTNQ